MLKNQNKRITFEVSSKASFSENFYQFFYLNLPPKDDIIEEGYLFSSKLNFHVVS